MQFLLALILVFNFFSIYAHADVLDNASSSIQKIRENRAVDSGLNNKGNPANYKAVESAFVALEKMFPVPAGSQDPSVAEVYAILAVAASELFHQGFGIEYNRKSCDYGYWAIYLADPLQPNILDPYVGEVGREGSEPQYCFAKDGLDNTWEQKKRIEMYRLLAQKSFGSRLLGSKSNYFSFMSGRFACWHGVDCESGFSEMYKSAKAEYDSNGLEGFSQDFAFALNAMNTTIAFQEKIRQIEGNLEAYVFAIELQLALQEKKLYPLSFDIAETRNGLVETMDKWGKYERLPEALDLAQRLRQGETFLSFDSSISESVTNIAAIEESKNKNEALVEQGEPSVIGDHESNSKPQRTIEEEQGTESLKPLLIWGTLGAVALFGVLLGLFGRKRKTP